VLKEWKKKGGDLKMELKMVIIHSGIKYQPVQFTTNTGAIVTLFVSQEQVKAGTPTVAYSFEELRHKDGELIVQFDKEQKEKNSE